MLILLVFISCQAATHKPPLVCSPLYILSSLHLLGAHDSGKVVQGRQGRRLNPARRHRVKGVTVEAATTIFPLEKPKFPAVVYNVKR